MGSDTTASEQVEMTLTRKSERIYDPSSGRLFPPGVGSNPGRRGPVIGSHCQLLSGADDAMHGAIPNAQLSRDSSHAAPLAS